MSDSIEPVEQLHPDVSVACAIAAGRVPADEDAEGIVITGAFKDLNSKGRGSHWYRMVYRGDRWRYVSPERLPSGSFRASDRKAEVRGEVFPGEIVVEHDHGGQVSEAYLVTVPDASDACLVDIKFIRNRRRELVFTLPDGSKVTMGDPRA